VSVVSRLRAAALAAAALWLAGCAGRYFTPVAEPPEALRFSLAELPVRELWSGLVMNGEKVGFSHSSISRADAQGRFELRSEAAMAFRLLGFDKRVTLKALDVVDGELAVVHFAYDYDIDGSRLELTGAVRDSRLEVEVRNAGRTTHLTFSAGGPVRPSSAIALYPLIHGLSVGREYAYPVFNGETQSVAEVTQRVEGFERSALFEGEAWKVVTALQGFETTSWIDRLGRRVFELAMSGILISALEDEQRARRYLAAASVNKLEALIDFSRVATDVPIANPRQVARLTVVLKLAGEAPVMASGDYQNCRPATEGEILCRIARPELVALPDVVSPDSPARYLGSSLAVPAGDARIRALAAEIGQGGSDPRARIQRVLEWISANIAREAADVFSALDVLDQRRAECQGHAYLYAALARALGIPTRVVNGLVYTGEFDGFLYHSWAESRIGDVWLPVDPTFGQIAADATHLKLVEGETQAELIALTGWLGRASARIVEVAHEDGGPSAAGHGGKR
jgi:hypothetical protein